MKFPKLNQKILRIGIAGFLFLSVIGSTVFTVHPVSASPTDAYWVGGSGDWSDATNHWATTSGGSPNSANLPASTTNVHFDGNSGSSITVNGAGEIYCNNMDWTGSVGIPTFKSVLISFWRFIYFRECCICAIYGNSDKFLFNG